MLKTELLGPKYRSKKVTFYTFPFLDKIGPVFQTVILEFSKGRFSPLFLRLVFRCFFAFAVCPLLKRVFFQSSLEKKHAAMEGAVSPGPLISFHPEAGYSPPRFR
jgi:hypothetical protein